MIGKFVSLVPLTLEHLPSLEQEFDPTLFKFCPKPYATAQEFVGENLSLVASGTYFPFAIIHNGAAIGCTEFSFRDPAKKVIEIGGSWLKPAFHRTAANAEAKWLLLSHAFEELGCIRVEFKTDIRNERSKAALMRIGATYEGLHRNAQLLADGHKRHTLYFSIIDDEWPVVKSTLVKRIQGKLR